MISTALSVFCSLAMIASLVMPAFGNKDNDALMVLRQNLSDLNHALDKLYENNIQGSISSELGDLKNLLTLDLNNNNISGIIPPSLRNLKQLIILSVSNTQVIGSPPPPSPTS
uniref:Uncharacterized protein n=1 Tax=Kalanchoe fedtschenkoi TaxID=63787 RepID=A0A7N0URY7_KALFE